MAILTVQQLVCDHCNEVLVGQHKAAERNRSYLQIQGRFTKAVWDGDLQRHLYVFLSPKENPEMTFCDENCLSKFAEAKAKQNLPIARDYYERKSNGGGAYKQDSNYY